MGKVYITIIGHTHTHTHTYIYIYGSFPLVGRIVRLRDACMDMMQSETKKES